TSAAHLSPFVGVLRLDRDRVYCVMAIRANVSVARYSFHLGVILMRRFVAENIRQNIDSAPTRVGNRLWLGKSSAHSCRVARWVSSAVPVGVRVIGVPPRTLASNDPQRRLAMSPSAARVRSALMAFDWTSALI